MSQSSWKLHKAIKQQFLAVSNPLSKDEIIIIHFFTIGLDTTNTVTVEIGIITVYIAKQRFDTRAATTLL